MEVGVERGRVGFDGEAPQNLAGVAPEGGADLTKEDVARLESARRLELRWHAHVRVGHGGGGEVVDMVGPALGEIGRLHDRGEPALVHAYPGIGGDGLHCQIGEPRRDFETLDLLG